MTAHKDTAPETPEVPETTPGTAAQDSTLDAQGLDNLRAILGDDVQIAEPVSYTDAPDAAVEALQLEVAQMKEQQLRDQAEMQNTRKRLQMDVEKARKFALEKFVGDLLPVVDNLDRAIDSTPKTEETTALVEGIELTRKSFLDVLAKFNVVQVNPHGEPFDPNLHQAIASVPNPDMEPNSVMDVMQKGYTLNERLLRAAMVVVSKAP